MLSDTGVLKRDSQGYLESSHQTLHSNSSAATNAHPLHFKRREDVSNEPSLGGDRGATIDINRTVEIAPRGIATRRGKCGDGLCAEIVQTIRQERIDIRFRAPVHLLVIVEEGVRAAGESSVEGLPRSTLRDLRRKLTFVPAGHCYHEWHQPSLPSRVIYFYFDPAKVLFDLEPADSDVLHAPRLFFKDTALSTTALKLGRLRDAPDANSRLCLEALGIILAHELVRPDAPSHPTDPRSRASPARY